MTRSCRIKVNGDSFTAQAGELLLDAALVNGVDMPFDCRSGYCGSCLVHLNNGLVIGGANAGTGMIHACQAHIVSDLTVSTDEALAKPAAIGEVAEINQLCIDVYEVVLALDRSPSHRPGQYYNVQFDGFPARAYSPTPALGSVDPFGTRLVRFHVKRLTTGAVSQHLETQIRPGHKTELFGPFGSACFEPGKSGRLVLVSSGTGFAPIWSIADAALMEQDNRSILLIAAAPRLSQLYMATALHLTSMCPNASVLAITSEKTEDRSWLRSGNLFEHLPKLFPEDTIHAAGAPSLIRSLSEIAEVVGCRMHADPFVATGSPPSRPVRKLAPRLFRSSRKSPERKPMPAWPRAAE